jgi:sugar lactone lactonase YvrE
MRLVADGFAFPEAPCVLGDGRLAFSDVVQGGIFALSPDGSTTELLPRRRGVGGLVTHADGGFVMTGRDLRHLRGEEQRAILDPPEGIAGFNDAGATPDGDLLVGALAWNPMAGEAATASPVWQVGPGQAVVAEWSGTVWPNGIQALPGGDEFVVADFQDGRLLRGRLDGPGPLEPYAAVPRGSSDGLAVDEQGGVFVALGPAGAVARLGPDGEWEPELDVPAEFVTSVCFTGPDRRTLVITAAGGEAGGALYSTEVDVAGLAPPPARA